MTTYYAHFRHYAPTDDPHVRRAQTLRAPVVRVFIDADTDADASAAITARYAGRVEQDGTVPMLTPLPVRYVAVTPGGALMTAAQGRYTWATADECRAWLDAVTRNNSADTLRQCYGAVAGFRSEPVPCWPDHFDPTRCVFPPVA